MENLTLNEDQLYYLRCLCQAVYQETGVWHQLHNQDEIIRLLRYSSMAPFEQIFGYFCSFAKLLDDEERQFMQVQNVFLPEDFNDDGRPDLRVV